MDARGSVIAGRYRLVDLVGSGGMGAVWEAWDERLHRRVALKQLHPQPQLSDADAERSTKRAMREARITARLHHPNAVPVFDVVEHEGRPCLIMQFLPSRPLSTVLREEGTLRPADAARVGAQVASALAAAHGLGIVHRDVKPGNILIIDDGRAMLSDFGISHSLGDEALTTTGVVHGTPAYLAPEVARGGDSSFASDVYSLGGTLYTAVEGRPPFGTEQNSMALLHRIASGEIVPPGRSGALTPELLRMLSTDPGDRPSMSEVAGILDRLASVEGGVAPATTEEPAAASPVAVPATRPLTPTATSTLPAAPPPIPRPVPVPVSDGRGRRRRRLRTIAPAMLVLTVLIGIAIAIAAIMDGFTDRATTAANRSAATSPPAAIGGTTTRPTSPVTPATSSGTPAASTRSPSPSPSPGASTPTATTRSSTAPPSTPPPSTPPPSTAPGSSRPASTTELAQAVTSYYALLPSRRAEGWSRLTRSYQTGHAGSRQNYDRFWSSISHVSVSGVSGGSPDRAEATVTYLFADGRTVRERTSYRLVRDGGVLKIDESTVLSSNAQ